MNDWKPFYGLMKCGLCSCLFLIGNIVSYAESVPQDWPPNYPSWWFHRDNALSVIDLDRVSEPSNKSPLLQGQLLNIAEAGIRELDSKLQVIGGAGFSIMDLAHPITSTHNYTPVNQGQLKFISSKFYDKLEEIGYNPEEPSENNSIILNNGPEDKFPNYPWDYEQTPTNYNTASLGQAKHLFSWDISNYLSLDSNSNSIPDWEEHFSSNLNANSDFDHDGFTNSQELLFEGADPLRAYASENIVLSVETRISSTETNPSIKLFSFADDLNAVYTRNPDVWVSDIDGITSISPWNSQERRRRGGTLISPIHIIVSAHAPIRVGQTVRFVDMANNLHERTIVDRLRHPVFNLSSGDINIELLNEPLPPEVEFVKVLPDNYQEYIDINNNLPVLGLDQQKKATLRNLHSIENGKFSYNIPDSPARLAYYEGLVPGDSGSPAFFIIQSELILLNVWTRGGAGSGSSVVDNKLIINDMMRQLGGGYQLTEFDLSGFEKLRN